MSGKNLYLKEMCVDEKEPALEISWKPGFQLFPAKLRPRGTIHTFSRNKISTSQTYQYFLAYLN